MIDSIASKVNQTNKLPEPERAITSDLGDLKESLTGQTDDHSAFKPSETNDGDKILPVAPSTGFNSRSSSPTPSVTTLANSEVSTANKNIPTDDQLLKKISRVSLWPLLTSQRPTTSTEAKGDNLQQTQIMQGASTSEPESVPPSRSSFEQRRMLSPSETDRQSELETKVVRECIREFTKGVMLFSYNMGESFFRFRCRHRSSRCQWMMTDFTIDITTSLQHKRTEVARLRKKTAKDNMNDENGEQFNILSEPNSTFPLWRRVTKQFWWNEAMLKPFIDAGVSQILGFLCLRLMLRSLSFTLIFFP